jgi:hypothetical protein
LFISCIRGLTIGQAVVPLRLFLSNAPFLDFRRYLLWVIPFFSIAVLGFGCTAFAFIIRGIYNETSRMFVVVAVINAHSFLACFSLNRFRDRHLNHHSAAAVSYVLGFNMATISASVLVQLFPCVSTFLLVGIHAELPP